MSEINIATDFPNEFKSLKKEIDALDDPLRQWSPSITDFQAILKSSVPVRTVHQMMGLIAAKKKNSVKRVNIFAHGDRTAIGFSGSIRRGQVFWGKSTGALLNEGVLDWYNSAGIFLEYNKKKYDLDDIKRCFQANASVVFYACNSGVDAALLKYFATTFGVTTVGFTKEIQYRPKFTKTPAKIERRRVQVGDSGIKTNFKDLDKFHSVTFK
jgi:hypothetical protein